MDPMVFWRLSDGLAESTDFPFMETLNADSGINSDWSSPPKFVSLM